MSTHETVFDWLAQLKRAQISFTMTSVRDDSIMFQAAVPGERWEIECFRDGHIEFERFRSNGKIEHSVEALRAAIASQDIDAIDEF
jgi:hypothetical protein